MTPFVSWKSGCLNVISHQADPTLGIQITSTIASFKRFWFQAWQFVWKKLRLSQRFFHEPPASGSSAGLPFTCSRLAIYPKPGGKAPPIRGMKGPSGLACISGKFHQFHGKRQSRIALHQYSLCAWIATQWLGCDNFSIKAIDLALDCSKSMDFDQSALTRPLWTDSVISAFIRS